MDEGRDPVSQDEKPEIFLIEGTELCPEVGDHLAS